MSLSEKIFPFLYEPDSDDWLGPSYSPPEKFEHAVETLVMTIPKDPPDGDGYNCEIYEERWPASFYKLVVKPTADSIDRMRPGWSMSTGSGTEVGRVLVEIARQVSQGMLDICYEEE